MATAQSEASMRYARQNIVRVTVGFNRKSEKDMKLYAHLKSQHSMNAYIHELIEADMKVKVI